MDPHTKIGMLPTDPWLLQHQPVEFPTPHDRELFAAGFKSCATEAIRYLVVDEGLPPDHPLVIGLQQQLLLKEATLTLQNFFSNQDLMDYDNMTEEVFELLDIISTLKPSADERQTSGNTEISGLCPEITSEQNHNHDATSVHYCCACIDNCHHDCLQTCDSDNSHVFVLNSHGEEDDALDLENSPCSFIVETDGHSTNGERTLSVVNFQNGLDIRHPFDVNSAPSSFSSNESRPPSH